MARVFAWPIKNLVARIKSSPNGILESKINIIRHDEIGELIKVFNKLTDKLKKAKASERFSSIGEAAVWVAHELKNSLAPIKSFMQLLPSKYSDGRFMDRFSNVIPEEISRCERMLKELSDFSSHSELNIDKINLKDIMDSVLRIMEDKFFEKGIKVRLNIENNGFYVWGDSERIKQVFINLIFNAVNAMPKGGSLTVSMALVTAVEINTFSCVEIKISDTGIGIPQERLKNIFEPFKTTQKDGMGLGLAISRKIIEQHNGDIHVESQSGKGTTFTIRFPAEQLIPNKPQVELG
jgi:signal transduction histidine kinase